MRSLALLPRQLLRGVAGCGFRPHACCLLGATRSPTALAAQAERLFFTQKTLSLHRKQTSSHEETTPAKSPLTYSSGLRVAAFSVFSKDERDGSRDDSRRNFTAAYAKKSSSESTSALRPPSWSSVFGPLLAGLPRAPLLGEQPLFLLRDTEEPAGRAAFLQASSAEGGAELISLSARRAESPPPAAAAAARAAAAATRGRKPTRRSSLYVIHTFNLHPYEALVFEEALYRFLGHRENQERRDDTRAVAPTLVFLLRSSASPTSRSESARGGLNAFVEDRTELPRVYEFFLQGQGGAKVKDGERTSTTQQHQHHRQGGSQPEQQQQPQPQVLRQRIKSAPPSVGCVFLHHPPYRPAGVNIRHQSSQVNGHFERPGDPLLYPPLAVIFGLSGQPAACVVRDPAAVLREGKALFIKRFSGGGTVVVGSGKECFCVGMLLPHVFARSSPSCPQSLLRLSAKLYLGENVWKTLRPSSVAAAKGAHSFRSLSTRLPGKAAASSTEGKGEEGRHATWNPTSLQQRHDSSLLRALSPFTVARWGLLENDYVVVESADTRVLSAESFPINERASSTSFIAPASTGTPQRSAPYTPSMDRPRGAAVPLPLADCNPLLNCSIKDGMQSIFKVGGNAQAISRMYGLQHTSFVWDEELLRHELKDLLGIPKRQPKYRCSRPDADFLRSVKAGLKAHVRVVQPGVLGEEEELSEMQGSAAVLGRLGSAEKYTSEKERGFESGSGCPLFLEKRFHKAGVVNILERTVTPPVQREGRNVENGRNLPLNTPSNVLLSLGLLLEGHVFRRNVEFGDQGEEVTSRQRADLIVEAGETAADRKPQVTSANTSPASPEGNFAAALEYVGGRIEEGLDDGEEEWDCIHCVVSPDDKIPAEFARLWTALNRLLDDEENEVSGGTRAAPTEEDCVISAQMRESVNSAIGKSRRLYVLPVEAVKQLVQELFVGSLKALRSTRLVDAKGEKIPEEAYRDLFTLNGIIPLRD